MHATEIEGVEFAFYQLNDVANVQYNQWEEDQGEDVEPTEWSEFESVFPDHFFPGELREAKIEKFSHLKQEGLTVKEYSLKTKRDTLLFRIETTFKLNDLLTMSNFYSNKYKSIKDRHISLYFSNDLKV